MSMKVLLRQAQIPESRARLDERGLARPDTGLREQLRKWGVLRSPAIGEYNKSWDVLETIGFLEEHVGRDEAVLDLGAYSSEVPVALHHLGFRRVVGIDLDPRLSNMPHGDQIRYVTGDFMNTAFEDGAFKAITSISVIEHGFDPDRLLTEVARLLQPGGYFIASFDYWPEKIDTSGTTFFGMDWLIFSADDVRGLLEKAAQRRLHPVGSLEFDGGDALIHCGGKDYTFGWLALQKRA
jgi:SAM-dependent methyltransferase